MCGNQTFMFGGCKPAEFFWLPRNQTTDKTLCLRAGVFLFEVQRAFSVEQI